MTTTKPTVYLAGGINGLTDAEAKGWRAEAVEGLGDLYEIRDPMARDYRGHELEGDTPAKIVREDLADITTADVILVRAERPSWGTAMEIVYAYLADRHIVVFGAGERPSPWLVHHADDVEPTLDAAVATCRVLAFELEAEAPGDSDGA